MHTFSMYCITHLIKAVMSDTKATKVDGESVRVWETGKNPVKFPLMGEKVGNHAESIMFFEASRGMETRNMHFTNIFESDHT